jgi:U3 small nucleolar RNA-associated protein 25
MHVLNHVLTSRTRVQRHNRRIRELGASAAVADADGGDVDRWRDQGYARPKVLVLLPTRATCHKFVETMIRLLGSSAIVDNWDRFHEEYGPVGPDAEDGGDDEDDDGEGDGGKRDDIDARARRAAVLRQKGPEWNELFGDDANADDDFKMGLSLTPNFVESSSSVGGKKRKAKRAEAVAGAGASSGVNVKLCADFYRSDIILASPIGLKMSISGNDEDDDEAEEADVDFLSSIDICVICRSDVLLMQNWDHVNSVLDSLNRQPRKVSDIDFSRVRNYHLEGRGSYWRQLILVSQFASPRILSTFRRHAENVEGSLRMRRVVRSEDASVCEVAVRGTRQVFQRVTCQSPSEAGPDRLRYFSEHVLPKLTRSGQKHTLIYVPSYFDFIALRNLLLKREADFVSITEYARVSEVSRGRARFLQGRKSIMLYTGRAHFFLRHKIKGARHVIFFGLPEYAEFYPAVVNMLNGGSSDDAKDGVVPCSPMSCLSLFTKFDAHQLERIVGTSNAERLIKQGEKSSFMFSL